MFTIRIDEIGGLVSLSHCNEHFISKLKKEKILIKAVVLVGKIITKNIQNMFWQFLATVIDSNDYLIYF